VWARDQGQCTFAGENGHRCGERNRLQFDHIEPVARGGEAVVENIRLRCRAHNQFEAERVFGAAFMRHRREEARRAAAEARRAASDARRAATETRKREAREARARAAEEARARAAAEAEARARARERAEEVIPWLLRLKVRPNDARAAAARCEAIPDASLEERVRLALTCVGPPARSQATLA
jgi:membrane protein involved in colicin uptake